MASNIVLVTGANGFVGTHVCRRLAERGMHVRALVRRKGETPALQHPGIEEGEGEFFDATDAKRAIPGADAVVHCAATVGDDIEHVRHINAHGTQAVANAALDEGVDRFVHISTGAVYDRGGREVVEEDTPMVTEGSPYAVTKAEAEEVVHNAHEDGLPTVILRPPAVLGPGPTSTWGTRVPGMVLDGELTTERSGETTLAWVHVEDLADAVVLALDRDEAVGNTYNVVGGHTTWQRYVDDIRSWSDDDLPSPFPPDAEPGWRGEFSTERIRNDLGWEPTRSYETAMEDIHQSWADRLA
ncbi:MAG: NAD(P)-dependent oxidoreductase [Nitriliruptorales bacterium]|nr:NAD(P)-dependent oxidoreductase [Nitriliruptorales bacterium]